MEEKYDIWQTTDFKSLPIIFETRLGSDGQNQQLLDEVEYNIVICQWRAGLRQIIDLSR